MKKLFIFLVCTIILSSSTLANTTIDNIEKSLYGFTYPNDNETVRLNRIEEKVYGTTSKANNQSRIAKLKQDLSADLIGQEISPREDTFTNEEDSIVYEKESPEAKNMDYPVINELEKQAFGKENKGQDIKTRLSNLEKKTFSKTYDKDDLSTRVDRLRAELRPRSFIANGMDQQDNDFYSQPADKLAQNYHLDQYGQGPFDYEAYNNRYDYNDEATNTFRGAKPINLTKIEKKLYNKKFDNEPTSSRLSRIESSVFGTSFPNDSDSERIARISSAIQAQKSSGRYDSNKFSQNMATAVQIGTLILMVLACIL
ncbi:hypothetical protein J6G99_02135 [bacterium]|nr:hypothetical protein [bacterium]